MCSTLAHDCRRTTAANAPKRISCPTILVACLATVASPASALVIQPVTPLQQQIKQDSPVIDVVVVHRSGAARRTTVVGPRGGVASRTVVRRGPSGRGSRRCGPARPLGAAGTLHLAAGRCDRRGCCDRIRHRSDRGGMGGRTAGTRFLPVPHRPEPDAGFFGRMPAVVLLRSHWRKCHDVAAHGHRAKRSVIGR
jgi:hypothetical protein